MYLNEGIYFMMISGSFFYFVSGIFFIESTFAIRIFSRLVLCHLLKTNLEIITVTQSTFNWAILLFIETLWLYFRVTALAYQ